MTDMIVDTDGLTGPADPDYFQVDYEIELLEELPEDGRIASRSPLAAQVEVAVRNPGKWVRIGLYGKKTAAPAARNVLRKRYGTSPAAAGFQFECRRVAEGAKTGLYARYTPDKIVPGAMDAHKQAMEVHERELEAARVARAAGKGAGAGSGSQGRPKSTPTKP